MSGGREPTLCWLRGEILPLDGAVVPARDRGFLFGEGVFETIRVRAGRAWRLGRHLVRLADSAAALGFEADETGAARAAEALLERTSGRDGVLKIVATAGDPPALPPQVLATLGPPRPLPPRAREDGVVAALAAWPHGAPSPLARVKSLACADRILARRAASRAGAFDAIFLDAAGHVAEGAATNVFWVRGGRLFTPALALGIVPGIARAAVLELGPADEGRFPLEHLLAADEAFLTNALVSVLPLRAIGGRPLAAPAPGPLTRELAARFETLVRCA